MNSRKPKQNLEHPHELQSERLQLAEAVPNKKTEASSWVSGYDVPDVMIQLPEIVRPPRSRLH
jgi:hypothetical protein